MPIAKLGLGDGIDASGVDEVAEPVGLGYPEVVCVEVHADGAESGARCGRGRRHGERHEDAPALLVLGDVLAFALAVVPTIVVVPYERSAATTLSCPWAKSTPSMWTCLPASSGEPSTMLAQPERERIVLCQACHATLASRRLVLAAEHQEL